MWDSVSSSEGGSDLSFEKSDLLVADQTLILLPARL